MKQDTEKGGADSNKSDAGESYETKKMEGAPSSSENDDKQKLEQLQTKKGEAKTTITKLTNLIKEDVTEFEKQIDQIKTQDELKQIEEILKAAKERDTERKNKLTPVSSTVIIPETQKDRNYLHFEFQISKEGLDKIQNKKLKLTLDVVGKNGEQFQPVEDSAANYGDDTNGLYVAPIKYTKNGLILVKIETHSYFNKELKSPEGKYKLTKI